MTPRQWVIRRLIVKGAKAWARCCRECPSARVLNLPHRLRYLLAWNHAICRAVLRVFVRALRGGPNLDFD